MDVRDFEYPHQIMSVYTDDLNIIDIHDKVVKNLEWESTTMLSILRDRLQQLQSTRDQMLGSSDLTPLRYHTIQSDIDNIKNTIYNIENGKRLNQYIEKSRPYIDKYREMSNRVVFNKEDSYKIQERLTVIDGYLNVVRQYIKIDVIKKPVTASKCNVCGLDLSTVYISDSLGYCPSCKVTLNVFNRTPNYSTPSASKSKNNNYTDRKNFYKALLRFQGKQDVKKLPSDIFTKLDTYFRQYNLPIGEEIKKTRSINEKGQRDGTSLQMMIEAIRRVGESCYEDAHLICRIYWGWELPDLTQYENLIMSDYDAFQREFENIKGQRKSSLNTQLLLYRLLRKNNINVTEDQFKIVKTDTIRQYQEELIDRIFKKLGWK
jgi:hypothetical protein